MTDRHVALLSGLPLLGGLAPGQLDALARLARLERYPAGATIFRKGDDGRGLMSVLRGRVQISVVGGEGRELMLNIIKPGEVFGEIALLDGETRTADAVALEDCELLALDRRDFIPFLHRTPEVAVRLLEVVSRRLRRTTAFAEETLMLRLEARLARQLLRLAADFGEPDGDGVRIGLRISQRQLGSLLGASRESVNKQLRAWQARRYLTAENGVIKLLARAELEAIAESG